MANFTLYELTEEARELQDMIEEYPPETFSDTIESLQLMIEDKADSYEQSIRISQMKLQRSKRKRKD